MSKKNMGLAVLACSLLFGIGLTSAYLINGQYKVNTFTIGSNAIDIVEEYDPPTELVTGENVYSKKVQVQNTGSVPCYVRVFAEFSNSEIEAISEISPDGENFYAAGEIEQYLPNNWVYIDLDSDSLLGGYYYYTEELASNALTIPLFEKIKTTFETADDISEYDIIVYSESIQSKSREGISFTGDDAWQQAWTEFLGGK